MNEPASETGVDEPAARALRQVRWLLIGVESLVALAFLWLGDAEHHPTGLLLVCGVLAAIDLASRGVRPLVHAATDVSALAVLSLLWGPHHPLQALALVEMTICATVLASRPAWSVTGLAIGLQVLDAVLQARGGEDAVHLVSHVSIGAVAAIALTWFGQAVARSLAARDAARHAAEVDRERAARLAVVGTLAAGVAHELATPLGSIELLAEEAGAELGEGPGRTALATLQAQVRRCRGILDRLLRRGDSGLVGCPAFGTRLQAWIDEWALANPGITATLEISGATADAAVPGDEASWRGAVWTLLDNARRAGAPILVRATLRDRDVVLDVIDRGAGPSPEVAARAGEPFFSAWPERGTGLGLYALRTFLEGVGGAFSLDSDSGGGRARVSVPMARGDRWTS
ncbi:MAG: HAMP domain-containing histidine kinase [Alphaproteobacteria bacterium]|nr:HAMP domain-containing histidine kinase [Alphaproteobacteria bacterium]